MTCKDCLHYEACKGTYYTAKGCDNIALYDFDGEMYADSGCEDFSERSEWVHLPCKVGSIVYRLNNIVDFDFCNECESFYKGGVSDFPCCEKTKTVFAIANVLKLLKELQTRISFAISLMISAKPSSSPEKKRKKHWRG